MKCRIVPSCTFASVCTIFFICTSAYLQLTLSRYKFHLVLECAVWPHVHVSSHTANRQFSLTPALSENYRGNIICVKFKFIRVNWCACYEPYLTERFLLCPEEFLKTTERCAFLFAVGWWFLTSRHIVLLKAALLVVSYPFFFSNTQESYVSLH